MNPPRDSIIHPAAEATGSSPAPDLLTRRHGVPAWLSTLLGSLSEAVVIADNTGRVVLLNRAATDLSGWSQAEAEGRSISEILRVQGEIAHPGADCGVRDCERCRPFSSIPSERILIRRGGQRLRVEATCTAVSDGDEVASYRIMVLRDLSERARTLEEIGRLNVQLTRRLQQLQTVLHTAPVGVVVAEDADCRSITSNSAMEKIVGIEPGEDIVGALQRGEPLPFRLLRGQTELTPSEWPLFLAARDGATVLGEVIQVIRADGSRLSTLVHAMPVRDEAGEVQGAVGVIVDITALERAKEALALANRRKDEFLAMLGHELRNPLAAVANAASLLRVSEDSSDRDWATDILDRQTGHLARLVDDLLDASRITLGKVMLKRRDVDATECVMRAGEVIRPTIEERGQTLEISLSGGPIRVHADPVRLEQVVVNLLTNASKFTPTGGTIRLEGKRDGSDVVVTVRDNGVGIPADRIAAMFELFTQGDHSLARSEGGLGIGLTLAKALVEMHGGTLSASSRGPGLGSEFSVRMPRLHPDTIEI